MRRTNRPDVSRIVDELQRRCAKCGAAFGIHGAPPPHTRGPDCDGFVPVTKKGKP